MTYCVLVQNVNFIIEFTRKTSAFFRELAVMGQLRKRVIEEKNIHGQQVLCPRVVDCPAASYLNVMEKI